MKTAIASSLISSMLSALIAVYFVQRHENELREKAETASRAYAQRQAVISEIIPVLETCRNALEDLTDHDSMMGFPLKMMRDEIVNNAKKQRKANDRLTAVSEVLGIKLEAAFDKPTEEIFGSLELQLMELEMKMAYFAFPKRIRTLEQFINDEEAYQAVAAITGEVDELIQKLSDYERRLITFQAK
jgi:hypothetical protein